jgi:AcrR family transcriptional regulator
MPKTGPKRDLDAERRVLDATRDLICERGPNRVSINEIATAAGVGKQTIYRWWPSKTAVVIDALERMFESESPFPQTGSAYDDIRTQMRRVATVFASPTGSIIRELVADSQGDPDIAEQFRSRFFTERRIRAAAAIQAGIDNGELRNDLDIETVIDVLYAPLWLRMLIEHQPLSPSAADRILDHTWPNLTTRPSR